MESWKRVWREGVAPNLSEKALLALQRGLMTDDPHLLQGATTTPPPLQCVADWPCEGGCLLAYPCWQGEGLSTIREVEEAFAQLCYQADQVLGEPAAVRWLLNWWDESPRQEVFRLLGTEVDLALSQRRKNARTEETPSQEAEAVHDSGD